MLNIFSAAFYLIALIIYSPILTLIGASGLLTGIIAARLISGSIPDHAARLRQYSGKLSGALCAGIDISPALKASGAENIYSSMMIGYEAAAAAQENKINRLRTISGAVRTSIVNIADAAILTIGALLVTDNKITPGTLLAFLTLFHSFAEPIGQLNGFVKKISTAKADMERADDIMKYPLDKRFEQGRDLADISAKLSGSVEYRSVSFGYSALADPLIEDLSFSLAPGSTIAFVGPSGCGKSTATKLVSGLYRPWSGEILFDGIPADKIPPEIIGASISTVSQNITLFSGTIRDNLTMWNPAVSEQDMINAARDACIHETIMQRDGAYEHMLSEGGANFSCGQRQRLEIARALSVNPTVLILDEATSALDPITEKNIIDNIRRRGCTCIIVAHRLSAVRDCDRIIVLEHGHVKERGSHEELFRANGVYRRLMSAE